MTDDVPLFDDSSSQALRIPMHRIGVLIGKGGSVRQQIEDATKSKMNIDSKTGEVQVTSIHDDPDPVLLLKARNIVQAIGRGFSPDQAMQLTDDQFYLEVIQLKPIVGKQTNRLQRVRSRVIGSDGRVRMSIESLSKCTVVILGSTISIIGKYEALGDAKEAILKLINGENIESVLGMLEERKKERDRLANQIWLSKEESEQQTVIDDSIFAGYDEADQN